MKACNLEKYCIAENNQWTEKIESLFLVKNRSSYLKKSKAYIEQTFPKNWYEKQWGKVFSFE